MSKRIENRKVKRIHINQHIIRDNRQTGARNPVITCKHSGGNDYFEELIIDGPCRVIYSPDKPLSCGAHVWIETHAPVREGADGVEGAA